MDVKRLCLLANKPIAPGFFYNPVIRYSHVHLQRFSNDFTLVGYGSLHNKHYVYSAQTKKLNHESLGFEQRTMITSPPQSTWSCQKTIHAFVDRVKGGWMGISILNILFFNIYFEFLFNVTHTG